jgi:peroxiredoxin (alkyl hydroperoxide reductase subunit C)
MSFKQFNLPQVGDPAPFFEVATEKGLIRFPEYCEGKWCVFFAHPANFTSAWTMFSAFLALKERWLTERNTKILALSNEPIGHNNWSDMARRYIGIYWKGPVIEDLDFRIAHLYGLASGRRPHPGCDRLAFIIDPDQIIRMIITRPLPNIENALLEIEKKLDELQGNVPEAVPIEPGEQRVVLEQSDAEGGMYKPRAAHFSKKKIFPN